MQRLGKLRVVSNWLDVGDRETINRAAYTTSVPVPLFDFLLEPVPPGAAFSGFDLWGRVEQCGYYSIYYNIV